MTVQWFGPLILKQVESIAEYSEKASAERIAEDARRNCPVSKLEQAGSVWSVFGATKPGSLKNSIKVRESRFKDGGYVVSAGDNKNISYASFIEFGVPAHGIEKKPFMRPAMKKEQRKFFRELKAKLT